METKFNFNSQVCTDVNQSRRLLALGLKKETADMHHWESEGKIYTYVGQCSDINGIPAWSLHRLIEMRLAHDSFVVFQLSNAENAFEKVISHIEHAIKEGYFNKEYLV